MSAARQQEDVITQQKRLLEEANRKLGTKQVVSQKPESQNSSCLDSPAVSPTFKSPPPSVLTNTIDNLQISNGINKSTPAKQCSGLQPHNLPIRNEEAFKSPLIATSQSFATEEKASMKFDALKTPSYFISKTATLEKLNSSVLR